MQNDECKRRAHRGPDQEGQRTTTNLQLSKMGDEVQITVIATGIDKENYRKVVRLRDVTPEEAGDGWTVRDMNGESLDVPTFQRMSDPSYNTLHREATENPNASKKSFFRRGLFKESLDYPAFLRAKAD